MIIRYAEQIIRFRWLVILAAIVMTVLLGAGGKNLVFTNDYRVFFSEGNPQLDAFEGMQETYTKNDNVLIMLEPKGGDVFTPEVLTAVVELTEESWQIPYSIRVDSISNFQHTYAEEDDLTVEDLVFEPESMSASELAKIKEIAVTEPRLVSKLVSPSGHVTGINITVETPGLDEITELPEVVNFTRAMIADFETKYPDIAFYDTGVVMMNQAFPEATQLDFEEIYPVMLLIFVVGLFVFLRSVSGVLTTIVIIFMSVMMAMGTAGWLGIKLTPPSASAPIVILTLAVADCVHVLVTMLHNLRTGMTRNEAIVESLRINFTPVFLTSVTTAIGFLSMNFSDAPPFRDLGNIVAIGVIYAFALSVTFLPAVMAVVPMRIKVDEPNKIRTMDRIADFVIAKRRPLFWVMGALIIATAAFIPKNELNDVFVEYFDESVPFRAKTDYITDNLSGMYFIDYSLDAKESSGISEPEFLNQLEMFERWLQEQPEVIHVNSYSEVMRTLNKNMHGDDQSYYKLPEERELAAQYLLLYEMSLPYGLDLNNQINVDKSATRMQVTLETLSTVDTLAFEKRVFNWMEENTPALTSYGASPTLMFSHIGMRNIISMLSGTSIALILISGLLIFALRSLKFGLLSLIPNLAPAAVAFGVWAIVVGQVGLALSVIVAMTLGIVVDDTIHFLSKYLRARREKGLEPEDAVRYAFSTVGVALFVTTVVLASGFMAMAQSTFELNASMGLLTAITITLALIIDFLFLPPLLMLVERNKQ
ncbi:MAG: MMPL family transporter [Pseudomonadota bacterium]